ncbi:MAG TPA: tetraacyldisaccharide 4'-kinase [Prevotella sp.]
MRREGDHIHINEWLLPLSWLYGLAVGLRNHLFEMGILKERSFSIPVIAVGNITVGGSGKTPHVEYLVRLLKDAMHVAVLSRGYKRKSSGYVLAHAQTPMPMIGDEPYQMKRKFPEIHVAVDKKRTRGINRLTTDEPTKDVDVILLDDAFQHRYVKPGINILLVDYHRLIVYDKLLPAGRLREPLNGKNRADMVIVTKCPKDLTPMEFRVLTKSMDLYPYQSLFFTTLRYGALQPLFGGAERELKSIARHHVLLLTGIASPRQLAEDLKPLDASLTLMSFGDHHHYTAADIMHINEVYERLPEPKVLVTTEKDAARLYDAEGLSAAVKADIYALPVSIEFMLGQQNNFNSKIISYVQKNSRNSILVKTANDNKSENGHHPRNRPRTISFRNH